MVDVGLPGFVVPTVNEGPMLLPGDDAGLTVPVAERADPCPDCPATEAAEPAAVGIAGAGAGRVVEEVTDWGTEVPEPVIGPAVLGDTAGETPALVEVKAGLTE